jgi:hypothetical protein
MNKNDLDNMESELREKFNYAVSVHANTKEIEKQLELVKLAKIGISAQED